MSDRTSCQCQIDDRRIPAFVIDNLFRRLFRPPSRFLAKYLSHGATAADLGCGPGFFSLPMARIVGDRGRVHAVDFDERVIERVKQKASRSGFSHILAPRAASASEIDFIETGSVDFVLAEGLLCCMKDHEGAMRQIKRILKADGRAYLSVIKLGRHGDPRNVAKEEWEALLSGMRVVDSGETAIGRWALVSPQRASA